MTEIMISSEITVAAVLYGGGANGSLRVIKWINCRSGVGETRTLDLAIMSRTL